ncbi:MAG: hypothetical protein J3K34DRAFT_76886 [Monoraphidium minutum]|nr:MAG: hypothetical protein J3K34DRAFT_76886 [Monoraphidium minutum]
MCATRLHASTPTAQTTSPSTARPRRRPRSARCSSPAGARRRRRRGRRSSSARRQRRRRRSSRPRRRRLRRSSSSSSSSSSSRSRSGAGRRRRRRLPRLRSSRQGRGCSPRRASRAAGIARPAAGLAAAARQGSFHQPRSAGALVVWGAVPASWPRQPLRLPPTGCEAHRRLSH